MLSTFVLKIIAIISMMTDHVGAVLFPDQVWMRYVGRLAFPIFCFLIAEGFAHTKNVPKYLMRLGMFALISEIPFNLAFKGKLFFYGGCNVFITLFLGLLALVIFDAINRMEGIPKPVLLLISLVPVAALCRTADSLGSDYGKYGVMLIFIFYIFRENRTAALLVFALSTLLKYGLTTTPYPQALMLFKAGGKTWFFFEQTQLYCLLAAIPLALYSGECGSRRFKWLFYAFYPAHLMILWLISLCM